MVAQPESVTTILRLVGESPGKLSIEDIKQAFNPQQRGAAVRSLNRLLSATVSKVHLRQGRLFLGPALMNLHEVMGGIDVDTGEDISRHNQTVADYVTLQPDYEREINLAQQAKRRQMAVIFKFEIPVANVKRVGVATRTLENSIQWIPPTAPVLEVTIESQTVAEKNQSVCGAFLALIVQTPLGFFLRYYQAPEGKVFVLDWQSEE